MKPIIIPMWGICTGRTTSCQGLDWSLSKNIIDKKAKLKLTTLELFFDSSGCRYLAFWRVSSVLDGMPKCPLDGVGHSSLGDLTTFELNLSHFKNHFSHRYLINVTRRQSQSLTISNNKSKLVRLFLKVKWNYFRYHGLGEIVQDVKLVNKRHWLREIKMTNYLKYIS